MANFASDVIRLVNPIGQPQPQTTGLAPRLMSLSGKSIGLINTGKPNIEPFLDELEALLRFDYPTIAIHRVRKDFTSAKPIAHELEGKVDAVVSAWGD